MVAGAGARRTGELVVALALAAAAVACSGDDADDANGTADTVAAVVATSTGPARPTTTTSLVYDPSTVEGQVEAAYLKSWDVYADAVYNLTLDEAALASVYAGEALEVFRAEIQRRIAEKRFSRFEMEHDLQVQLVSPTTALVLDQQVNHHVLVDPDTREPIEADPNTRYRAAAHLELGGATWRVTRLDVTR